MTHLFPGRRRSQGPRRLRVYHDAFHLKWCFLGRCGGSHHPCGLLFSCSWPHSSCTYIFVRGCQGLDVGKLTIYRTPDSRERTRYTSNTCRNRIATSGCLQHDLVSTEQLHSSRRSIHVLFSRTLSSLSREGIALLPRPSGLIGLLPVPTRVEYSLMSLYSGFLYQMRKEGRRMLMVLKLQI